MATIGQAFGETQEREAVEGGARFDWVMLLLSAWWIGGGLLDGWAHSHIPRLETFFTPWHAALYSGFLVVALFLLVTAIRGHAQGFTWTRSVPRGYELSLLGVGLFAVGGVLDLLWHLLFGIEQGVTALLSPTHVLLNCGTVLVVSGPLRAAWQRPVPRQERPESLLVFLPVILSLTYVLICISFFTIYAHPIAYPLADKPVVSGSIGRGVISILFQMAVFMGIVLFALRRWQLPFLTFTIIYGLNSTLAVTQGNLSLLPAVAVAALLTGGLLDLLFLVLKPSVQRREALRLFAFLAPVVIQTIYFLMLFATSHVTWVVHVWTGAIVLSGVVGLLLSFLLVPLPVRQEEG